MTFTNTYKATGRAEISGTKELTGNRKTSIGKDEFAFEVVNTESGAVVGTAVLNGGNYSEDFTITFNKDVGKRQRGYPSHRMTSEIPTITCSVK